ncbi:MAG: ATP-binding protein [Leptolyngbya sp. SIO1E4]|nr:ATP-binding protein [Leptolyngbya sp. SIO1E4]
MSRGRSLKQAIQRSVNPFDPTTFKPGNFWQESPDSTLEVEAIHQSVLQAVDTVLEQVRADSKTRTLLLTGDSGSGKSHLLGRIKRQLNDRAFFTYIGPWADSQFIWRHILRNTVDSLLQTPEDADESQLLLWLRSLPALQHHSLVKWVRGKRAAFIKELQTHFPIGLYKGKEFCGVLYDLLNPDLCPIATDWLRGDDLEEGDLKAIKVKQSIDSEDAAQKLLANFGRIANATLPIVLCFDNLDNIPLLPDNRPDLQALFHVNSTLHNEKLNNFLLLISLITSTWKQHKDAIQPADVARIDQTLSLRPITLNQAEALWKLRLAPVHAQVSPPPETAIAPLTRSWLEYKFPGRRTLPRNTLMLGQQLIEQYQRDGALPLPSAQTVPPSPPPPPPAQNQEANFALLWHREFQKVQSRITRITQKSSPELIRILWEVLSALAVADLEAPFLTGTKYSAYSLRYRQSARVGMVWSEDRHMTSFYYLMRACERAIEQGRCDRLYLIRAADISQPQTQGHQIYRQIFAYANYLHIEPDLASVHYLETYHGLVNAAAGGELVVGRTTPTVQELQSLVRKTGVLNYCPLLQELEVVPELDEALQEDDASEEPSAKRYRTQSPHEAAKQYALNLVSTQQFMGLQMLLETLQAQFPDLSNGTAQQVIHALIDGEHLRVLDATVSLEEQIVCLMPTENVSADKM